LADLLKPVVAACANAIATLRGAPDAPRAEEGKPHGDPSAEPARPGEIRDRADALQVLDAVCKFFERTEPGNPAPLLIRRAQRLVGKNFVEIMQDLAPESLTLLSTIAGIKNE
jgi:type VI secretion system protein ImpA